MIQTGKTLLLDELQEKSKNWIEFLEQLDEKTLNADLTYKRVSGQELTLPYAATLMHVFNHGTHHRGQITAAMTLLPAQNAPKPVSPCCTAKAFSCFAKS